MIPPIVAQIIGLAAVCLFLLSYQMKSRGGIIAMNLTSRILYVVQYLLLGAISGAVLDILGSVASLVAGKRNAPFMKKHIRLVFIRRTSCQRRRRSPDAVIPDISRQPAAIRRKNVPYIIFFYITKTAALGSNVSFYPQAVSDCRGRRIPWAVRKHRRYPISGKYRSQKHRPP